MDILNNIGFQNVYNIGDKGLIGIIEDNLKSFMDYSFLKIGAFIDVDISTPGICGTFSVLKPAKDPELPENIVWEAPRKDWVYESNVCHNTKCPISVSGIYVNNNFIPGPTGNNDNAYKINYPMGQIVFDKPKFKNDTIKAEYSYRYVQIYTANTCPWWIELQKLSYMPGIVNNAIDNITSNHRVQLPSIIIETIPRNYQTPYELGNVKNILTQDVLLHIYTENINQRNSIIDILLLQKDKETFLYDVPKVLADNVYPINIYGQINNSGLNYNQIISNPIYQKNVFYISDSVLVDTQRISTNLYSCIVRWSLKIYP